MAPGRAGGSSSDSGQEGIYGAHDRVMHHRQGADLLAKLGQRKRRCELRHDEVGLLAEGDGRVQRCHDAPHRGRWNEGRYDPRLQLVQQVALKDDDQAARREATEIVLGRHGRDQNLRNWAKRMPFASMKAL